MKFVNEEKLYGYIRHYAGDVGIGGKDPILVLVKSNIGNLTYMSPRQKIICPTANGIFEGLSFVKCIYGLHLGKDKCIFMVLHYESGEDKILFIGNDVGGSDCCEEVIAFAIIPSYKEEGALSEYTIQTSLMGEPFYGFVTVYSEDIKPFLKNTLKILIGFADLGLKDNALTIEACLKLQAAAESVSNTEESVNAKKD